MITLTKYSNVVPVYVNEIIPTFTCIFSNNTYFQLQSCGSVVSRLCSSGL
jgi:hypothetical protein